MASLLCAGSTSITACVCKKDTWLNTQNNTCAVCGNGTSDSGVYCVWFIHTYKYSCMQTALLIQVCAIFVLYKQLVCAQGSLHTYLYIYASWFLLHVCCNSPFPSQVWDRRPPKCQCCLQCVIQIILSLAWAVSSRAYAHKRTHILTLSLHEQAPRPSTTVLATPTSTR